MKTIAERHGATIMPLSVNYRSHDEILGVATNLIEHNRERVAKELNSLLGAGGSVRLHARYWADGKEPQAVASTTGRTLGSWGVIARTNRRLDGVARALEEAGIAFSRPGRAHFLESEDAALFLRLPRASSRPTWHYRFRNAMGYRSVNAYCGGTLSILCTELTIRRHRGRRQRSTCIFENEGPCDGGSNSVELAQARFAGARATGPGGRMQRCGRAGAACNRPSIRAARALPRGLMATRQLVAARPQPFECPRCHTVSASRVANATIACLVGEYSRGIRPLLSRARSRRRMTVLTMRGA